MLSILGLFAACMGDATGPEANTSSIPVTPAAFRIIPSAVTVETNQPVRFRGENHGRRRSYAPALNWLSTGGAITAEGIFSSSTPGTYKVVGRGRGRQKSDTAVVVVVPPTPDLVGIELSPGSTTVGPGAVQAFAAVGRLADSTTTPVGVTWTASGGTIDPSGMFTAGSTVGSFRVVATNTSGTLADTAQVTIATGAESPVVRVALKPTSLTLATGSSGQFAAFGRTGAGDSVAIAVRFTATGGTISAGGLYTAGPTSGSYRVIAESNGLADTTVVTVTRTLTSGSGSGGIPYGVYSAWETTSTYKSYTDPFNLSIGTITASNIIPRIEAARTKGKKLILGMTGGAHDQYKTAGVFDMAKWRAKMETYNTASIKAAVAAGVADGTIVGNSVMDEPHNTAHDNSWGPKGTLTKAMVDQMCGVVKAMFPTLPAGVVHPHDVFEPAQSYRVCDFIVSQYSHRKTLGDIQKFRDEALAMGRRDGHAIAFSLNILDGGVQAERDGLWRCSATETAGRGTYDPNCRMTPQQVREWGIALGNAGCALTMWRYDAGYMADAENRRAFEEVAGRLASLPAKACRRG